MLAVGMPIYCLKIEYFFVDTFVVMISPVTKLLTMVLVCQIIRKSNKISVQFVGTYFLCVSFLERASVSSTCRKTIKNTQKVEQNAVNLDRTGQDANCQGTPAFQATNSTETNNLPATGWFLPAT